MELLKDLAEISGVKKFNLDGLTKLSLDLFSHYISCAKQENTNLLEIDIGIGSLIIRLSENEIDYKFIPSKNLEWAIKDGLVNKESILIKKANTLIGQRINKTYKELI